MAVHHGQIAFAELCTSWFPIWFKIVDFILSRTIQYPYLSRFIALIVDMSILRGRWGRCGTEVLIFVLVFLATWNVSFRISLSLH